MGRMTGILHFLTQYAWEEEKEDTRALRRARKEVHCKSSVLSLRHLQHLGVLRYTRKIDQIYRCLSRDADDKRHLRHIISRRCKKRG